MAATMGNLIAGMVDRLVRWVVIPVTSVIPFLVSSGILLVGYAALWAAFAVALVASPSAPGDAWRSIGQLALPVQGVAWLLFLPLMAGLWVWQTDWPFAVRLLLVAGIGAWNLLVFVPRQDPRSAAADA